ncbi:longitudinals lacking protein, isoforms J/P/Q/S/Z-like isoform X2 [Anopheles maculipalpis]|uniref:longitudinals lacking protein, isoforms J/P/Q/S/Z-like isoform X2 n=1 Tax=Anopheles maculipalpis TaxID=1496333 RepID=UPI002158DD89|nr:longitudinals lacking protein, isoforms J/P/Q/S/Z-like isoform X2 [Anopheles maculipalpis]
MDDDQQFCLRWNNHQSTLISVFDTLLENGTLVDCTLAAEGKFLKAHKVVLSACSPYFATLLSQQYDKHPIFILKDVKFQELRAMMDYMYRGEVNISQDQLAALLKAAESLQIKGLSDNRSSSGSSASGSGGGVHPQQQQKQSDAPSAKSLQPPVPASKGSGLTIENKRSLKSELLESDVSGSREGSTSPTSRKRKKVRRRSVDTNNLIIDNHDQHSNSSSHSMHTGSGANAAVSAVSGTSANVAAASSLSSSSSNAAAGSNSSANVLSVAAVAAAAALKKTETVQQAETLKLQKQQAAAAAAAQSSDDDERCGPGSVATGTEHDDGNDLSDNEHDGDGGSSVKSGSRHHHLRDGSRRGKTSTSSMGEMMIEPKSEYEDVQDENVEDLTMDDEDLMDELDQPGPSHGGDVSSQGYAQWPMDREQNEAFIAAQDAVGGQHRDAQDPEDSSSLGGGITKIKLENFWHDNDLIAFAEPVPNHTTAGTIVSQTKLQRNITTNATTIPAWRCKTSKSTSKIALAPMVTTVGRMMVAKKSSPSGGGGSMVAIMKPLKTTGNGNVILTSAGSLMATTMTTGGTGGGGGASSNGSSASSIGSRKEEKIMFQHENDAKPWKCKSCGRNYKWKNSLKCHIKNECGVPPKYFCERMCGYKTHIHSNLKRHLNSKFCKPN